MYDFFAPVARSLRASGRVLVLGTPPSACGELQQATAQRALEGFVRSLAKEVGSRNITVNAVAPGFIETDMSEAVRNKAGEFIKKVIPMKRVGKPEEIADVVAFLAGPAASYCTGGVYVADGGHTL